VLFVKSLIFAPLHAHTTNVIVFKS